MSKDKGFTLTPGYIQPGKPGPTYEELGIEPFDPKKVDIHVWYRGQSIIIKGEDE